MAHGNVNRYSVKIASEASNPHSYKSVVYLDTTAGIGFLYFCPDDAQLPENSIRMQHGRPTYYVWYHHSYLVNVIDLLRNEKPILFFFDDRSKYAGIMTSEWEPTGEEE
jgi:hypothetical protein